MLVGFIGLDSSKVAQFFVNCLAVGGGFLAGFLLTWISTFLLDRWITRGRTPEPLHRIARILGGVAAAVLVALIVFGQGGNGYGLGGDAGEGKGDGQGLGHGTVATQPTAADVRPIETTKSEPVPPEQRVRVTMLGGEAVKEERFYLLDDDPGPRTLEEIKTAVAAKKGAGGKPVGIEIRFTRTNTLPRSHPAVLRLTSWAQANGVTVTFPA